MSTDWRREVERGYATGWPRWFDTPSVCRGYSGCNCWECGCECGECFKCNPRAHFPMSAEQTLTTHWKACVESADAVCVAAFVDHLMELWDTAVAEDGEFARQTGASAPVLRLVAGEWTLIVDHGTSRRGDSEPPQFGVDITCTKRTPFRAGEPHNVRRVWKDMDHPPAWDYRHVQHFTFWLVGAIVSGTRQPT